MHNITSKLTSTTTCHREKIKVGKHNKKSSRENPGQRRSKREHFETSHRGKIQASGDPKGEIQKENPVNQQRAKREHFDNPPIADFFSQIDSICRLPPRDVRACERARRNDFPVCVGEDSPPTFDDIMYIYISYDISYDVSYDISYDLSYDISYDILYDISYDISYDI